jgi:hypothetical protein
MSQSENEYFEEHSSLLFAAIFPPTHNVAATAKKVKLVPFQKKSIRKAPTV